MDARCIHEGLEKIFALKCSQKTLTGWFEYQDLLRREREAIRSEGMDPDDPMISGELLCRCVKKMTLDIPEGSVLAGTQDDAFSPSYALINPAFLVESFAGYCDPVAIYSDIPADAGIPTERVEAVRSYFRETPYVKKLTSVYEKTSVLTDEVAFFMEPVTGHMIPDMRPILSKGLDRVLAEAPANAPFTAAIKKAAQAAAILARRYAELASRLAEERKDIPGEKERLTRIAENCSRVPMQSARNLHEALQGYLLLWQVMCLEQAPNPYAFSAGNLDRVFQPYLSGTDFETAVELFRHLLTFFMVGARGWAISQNFLLGGRDGQGKDLTCEMTNVILEAFYRSNQPQPALSVKIHRGTPASLYENMGRFYFTPGHSTPSLFNDDMMFRVLADKGIRPADIPDWAVAGCQEPLIMGKENGNTTNTWLNLGKVLELTLNDGKSLLTGRKIGQSAQELGYASLEDVWANLEKAFLRQLDYILPFMEAAGNRCTETIADKATPFGSLLFGGLESGRDMRDFRNPGTAYCGSGCLIHGLSVVADSLVAVKHFLAEDQGDYSVIRKALQDDFEAEPALRARLLAYPKYGSNQQEPDQVAARLASVVSDKIHALRNPAGKPYMPDYSTPSTHLLYGYWVGATPDGRKARTMLGYGVDPRPEVTNGELTDQLLSERGLPFSKFVGGYASHIGLNPSIFLEDGLASKGLQMRDRVIQPLFRDNADGQAPFYVYFNIDSAANLRKILSNPKKYAPSGIYIMRIHGTFVNFLDLAPAIQEDIMKRMERNERT